MKPVKSNAVKKPATKKPKSLTEVSRIEVLERRVWMAQDDNMEMRERIRDVERVIYEVSAESMRLRAAQKSTSQLNWIVLVMATIALAFAMFT